MTSSSAGSETPPSEAVARVLGIDVQADGVRVHDAKRLPDRLALYVPNLFYDIKGSSAATAVADLLEQSLPPGAPISVVMDREAGPELDIVELQRLRVLTIDAAAAIYIPAVDARVEALGALYAADVMHSEQIDVSSLSRRAAHMASGAWDDRATLDVVIGAASEAWRIERMPAVDRNLLRLGAFELLHSDVPKGAVIDEAVTLAKAYSTEASGRFVNGVLDAIASARSDGSTT